jgi:hypothetical protein
VSNRDQILALSGRVQKELKFLDNNCQEEVVIDAVSLLVFVIVAELEGQEPDKREFTGFMKSICQAILNHPEIQKRML